MKTLARPMQVSRVILACAITLNALLVLPAAAFAQGETPRCPDAPMRVPSGNWTLVGYFNNYTPPGGSPGSHWGVDYVDRTKAITTTQGYFPENSPRVPVMRDPDGDGIVIPAELQGVNYPENLTPVYSPVTGYLENPPTLYGFPGSVIITTTLDNTWQGRVLTRNLRLWLTHMASWDGAQSYVVRSTGPVSEGDLIGYEGKGGLGVNGTTHLHIGFYNSNIPIMNPGNVNGQWQDGVITPTTYLNSWVDGVEAINAGIDDNAQDYPVVCKLTPVGQIEFPFYGGYVRNTTTTISGYALDRTNVTQLIGINGGVDRVRVYLDGYDPATSPTQVGTLINDVPVNIPRPDIQARFGGQPANSGWQMNWTASVSLGRHGLYMYARQVSTGQWRLMDVRYVVVTDRFLNWLPLILR